MKRVFSTLFLALVVAVFAVGCGSDDGGLDAVPTNSVAVVGDQSIPKSEFDDLDHVREAQLRRAEAAVPEGRHPRVRAAPRPGDAPSYSAPSSR